MARNLTGLLFVFLLVSAHPLSINACVLGVAGAAVGSVLVALTATWYTGTVTGAVSLVARAMSLAYTTCVGVIRTLQAAGADGVEYALLIPRALLEGWRYAYCYLNTNYKVKNQQSNICQPCSNKKK